MTELILTFVFYTIPALYLIYIAHKNKADSVAFMSALIPLLNIIMACYVLWYYIKRKK